MGARLAPWRSAHRTVNEPCIPRYRTERLLGKGANANVYLATDLELERPVALKVMDLTAAGAVPQEEVRARFRREAKLTARLSHPNIVTVYDFGETGDSLFIAMEFVAAGSLAQRLARGAAPLPVPERVVLGAEIADALAHAHERGVLHRDLKPANILLSASGAAKVSDFGIGKLLGGDVDLTATGEMVGSPAYMSPEQARGERVDARSDIFGLGVVLFHLLTGRKPFEAKNLPAIVAQIENAPPPDPLAIEPALPPEVAPILFRCLAKDKHDRYPDAAGVARDLRALVPKVADKGAELSSGHLRRLLDDSSGEKRPASELDLSPTIRRPLPLAAREVVPTLPTWRSSRRRWAIRGAAAAAVVALAASLFLLRRQAPKAQEPSARAAARPTAPAPSPTSVPPAPAPDPLPGFLAALHETWPAPPALRAHAVARSGLELHVLPGMASVFLDGRYVGVADDWTGRESSSLLAFSRDWRHVVRVVHPGYGDLEIDLVIARGARERVAVVAETLPEGTSSAPAGAARHVEAPALKTSGALHLEVTPPGALVSVDGVRVGEAREFARTDLLLEGPAVHTLVLSAPDRPPVTLRVLVSSAVRQARPTLRRAL